MKKAVWIVSSLALVLPSLVFALVSPPPGGGPVCDNVLNNVLDPGCVTIISSPQDIFSWIVLILSYLRNIFWILAIAMVFYAAYLYLFGGAGEKNVEAAKKVMRYAIIAMAVALLATSIPFLVRNFLGG